MTEIYSSLITIFLLTTEIIARKILYNLTTRRPLMSSSQGNFSEKYHHNLQNYCNVSNWDAICQSNDTRICAVRPLRKNIQETVDIERDMEKKDFNNSCYLFLSNICENSGHVYYIIADSDCGTYLARRRNVDTVATTEPNNEIVTTEATIDDSDANIASTPFDVNDSVNVTPDGNATEDVLADYNGTLLGNHSALRSEKKWPKYKSDTPFDPHIHPVCPLSCPTTYKPECFIINRATQYMKMFSFVNHCLGDLYYCEHPQEFTRGPNNDPKRFTSDLTWAYCAAFKFLNFARFSEVLSSMGHYGWLAGDFKMSHIMEPHERMPGYG